MLDVLDGVEVGCGQLVWEVVSSSSLAAAGMVFRPTSPQQLCCMAESVLSVCQVITDMPIEEWPLCDALLSWHSEGFPLKKVSG